MNHHLHVLERPAGSVCRHPRAVLHGVSALTAGTRKSLFVVDRANGLGELGVVDVTSAHVEGFKLRERLVKMCSMCSDHVLLPCGHVCVCYECVGDVRECPRCKRRVEDKRKILL